MFLLRGQAPLEEVRRVGSLLCRRRRPGSSMTGRPNVLAVGAAVTASHTKGRADGVLDPLVARNAVEGSLLELSLIHI
eukprot:11534603-Alexandrium_andersonii.AAC.1